MKKYTKAVSATLAGALAVGMVPAMALADEVPLQATTDAETDYSGGKISAATDDEGVAIADMSKAITLTLDANGTYLVPGKVTTKSGTAIDITDEEVAADYNIAYYQVAKNGGQVHDWSGTDSLILIAGADADLSETSWTAGDYYVAVWPKNMDESYAVAQKYTVVSAALTDLSVYEINKNAADGGLSDVEFAYTGVAYTTDDFGLAYNGKAFKSAKVTGFLPYGSSASASPVQSISSLGKYYAIVEGTEGEYVGTKTEVLFELVAYDLSKDADLTISDFENAAATPGASDLLNIDIDSSLVNNDNLKVAINGLMKKGTNSATISVVKSSAGGELEGKVIGTKTVSFKVVDDVLEADRFYMDGKEITEKTVKVDLSSKSSKAQLFDADTVVVLKTGAVYATADDNDFVDEKDYDVVVTDAKGNKANLSDLETAGTWKVTVKVDDADNVYGGASKTITYVVYDGTVDADAEAFVKFEGKTVTSIQTTYDGKDVIGDIETIVKSGDDTLTAGTDYAVKYERKDAKGDWVEVTEIVNAGEYRMTISSDTYKEKDTEEPIEEIVYIVVDKLEVYPVIADEISGEPGFDMLWTGAALDPVVGFKVKNAKGKYVDLPANLTVTDNDYSIKITEFVDQASKETAKVDPKEFVNAGDYIFTIKKADSSNFTMANILEYNTDYDIWETSSLANIELTVDGRDIYVDVPAKSWFANSVYKISVAGVMGGYGNGKFDPYGNAERQQLAVTLLRMFSPYDRLGADGENWGDNYIKSDYNSETILPFTDTDKMAYYAEGVWYCYKNGLMTGYTDGSGEFGVGDTVTREQAVTTLYRADKAGMYKAASKDDGATILASALDSYKDSDDVSKYAVEAMAWAVENGIIGVGTGGYLNPDDEISRAELATILVRYMELRNMDMTTDSWY